MNILITGAAGFIGSTLAKELKNENLTLIDTLEYGHLSNLDHLSDKLIVSDCFDHSVFNKPDVIIHFAGISSLPECEAFPIKAYKNNVDSTVSILQYARDYNCKVIFASTSAVYENVNENLILSEDIEVHPSFVYANTKLAAENICKSFAKNYDLDITICRFFNVFGPNQDFTRKNPPFTSALVKSILSGSTFTLFNNTDAKRDYIYVDDIVHIIKKMIYSNKKYNGDIFNLTSQRSYSTMDIISILEEVSKSKLSYELGDPTKFWSKYTQLEHLSVDSIKHELYKSAMGSNAKVTNEFLGPNYQFRSMADGLSDIINFQQEF